MRTKQPPQENELKEACQSVKNDHPDFGVKRVFKELEQRKPRWRLTEKRVQKCMKKYGLTCSTKPPPSPLRDDDEVAPTVFPEDCVCLRSKPAQLGWVLKASGVLGGDDDYDDDDEEEEESRAVPEGSARVQWLDHYEPRLESTDAVEVVDRPFVVGDVVARADDPTGALGAVVKVSLRADVRVVYSPTSVTVPPPPPPRNQRRRGRSAGRREPSPKPPPLPQKIEGTLRNIPAASLKPATGLRMGDPVAHRTRGRWVGRVVGATYDVTVRCNGGALCVVQGLGDNGAEQLVEPVDDADYGFDELCPFFPGQRVSAPPSVWRRASWKNGARAPQGRRRRSGVVEKVEVSQAGVQWLAWGVGASRDPPPAWASVKEIDILTAFAGLTRVGDHVCGSDLPDGSCAQVIRTETRCSVRWSSSEDSPEVASLELVPRQHLGEHDFLPNDFVVKRLEESSDVGVIRVVDAKERTCSVKFGDTEETMSSYELALSSADNYSAGDLVLRVNQSSSTEGPNRQTAGTVSDQTDFGTEDNEEAELAEAIRRSLEETPSTETSTGEERWVGQVLSLSDGKVRVLWVDGSKEEVAPSELLLVPDASGEEPYNSEEEASDGESLPTQPPVEAPVAQSPVVESDDDDSDDEDTSPFAIVEEPPQDHAYGHTAPHQVPLKQVRKLWAQLGKHLPPGVHVRAFEKRTDLLRAVIVGPTGTPYDGFLFWFDLQLPETYPSEPPSMHYHAWGLSERLNPNLYENGKVCLSLLGTWSGPGWDPESSTLLQLLVSVQGLVLVDKPYYNEPGHERHADTVEGEQQARLYNENARLLSLQATTAACRRPPRPFRGVVAAHFASSQLSHTNNTMHSKLLLASTFGAAAAFQAPAASKATSSLQAMYNPSSFDDVQSLPGILNPTGFFDPAGLSNDVSASELKRYREAELTHGRVAMLASLGFLVGESGFTPLFEGKISGIGINQFWQVPTGFWPVILLFIAVPETFRALRGWMEPTVPENYFQLRPGYTPGDLDFDPLGLKPEDPEALKEMQTKELQHGRLAMLAAAGMIVQELQTGATLF